MRQTHSAITEIVEKEKVLFICLLPQGDDSSPPLLCGLIFFEGDRCLCVSLKFVVKA
jgi:hypothetical protein